MVWVKRLLALAAAAGMIVGAIVVRSEVIEGDDDGPGTTTATTLVCIAELRAVCDAVAAEHGGLRVRVEQAAATSRAWGRAADRPDEAWLTVAPLPELVDAERSRQRLTALALTVDTIGATQLVVAVPNAKAAALAGACGEPLDWRCIGDAAGTPWTELAGPAAGSVRPAFGSLDSAVGQLGVAQAVLGFFGAAPVDPGDPGLITWGRRLSRAVAASALSGGTPIGTVQVRDSALDVAVGFDAEIAKARRDRLTVLYAAPMTRVDLVLATPAGVSVSGDVRATLTSTARELGGAATVPGEPLAGEHVAQATHIWDDLT